MDRADPQKKAAIRRSLKWIPISYAPLLAGLAWAIFAANRWPGNRGHLLAASGLLLSFTASAAAFFPVLRVASSRQRLMGMSLGTYTLGSIIVGIVSAAILAVTALATR